MPYIAIRILQSQLIGKVPSHTYFQISLSEVRTHLQLIKVVIRFNPRLNDDKNHWSLFKRITVNMQDVLARKISTAVLLETSNYLGYMWLAPKLVKDRPFLTHTLHWVLAIYDSDNKKDLFSIRTKVSDFSFISSQIKTYNCNVCVNLGVKLSTVQIMITSPTFLKISFQNKFIDSFTADPLEKNWLTNEENF